MRIQLSQLAAQLLVVCVLTFLIRSIKCSRLSGSEQSEVLTDAVLKAPVLSAGDTDDHQQADVRVPQIGHSSPEESAALPLRDLDNGPFGVDDDSITVNVRKAYGTASGSGTGSSVTSSEAEASDQDGNADASEDDDTDQLVRTLGMLLEQRIDRKSDRSSEQEQELLAAPEKRFRFGKSIARGGKYFRSLRQRHKRFRFGKSIARGSKYFRSLRQRHKRFRFGKSIAFGNYNYLW